MGGKLVVEVISFVGRRVKFVGKEIEKRVNKSIKHSLTTSQIRSRHDIIKLCDS
jgi:hypothetical protein